MQQNHPWEANWSTTSQEIPAFYGTRRFITHSQVPDSCPYYEKALSSPYPHIPLFSIKLNIILPINSWVFPSGFPTKTLCAPLLSPKRATCPVQLILIDFITRTIMGKEYRSLSSSLGSFLYSPVTSSLLGPNILNILFSNTLTKQSKAYVSKYITKK